MDDENLNQPINGHDQKQSPPSEIMKTKERHWRCKRGHSTFSKHKPDVCRECKKTLTDLWLSSFTEVK